VSVDPEDARFRLPTRQELRGAVPYFAAGALYVLIAVFAVDFMLSVFVAMAYLLVVVWLVPLAIRRLR
jgi:hypothetical protein